MYYYNLMRFLVLNRLQFLGDTENVYWSTRAFIYIFASIQQTWLSFYNGNKALKFVLKKVFKYGHGGYWWIQKESTELYLKIMKIYKMKNISEAKVFI